MKEVGVNTNSIVSESKKDDRFEGKTFLIAGTLPTLKRDEAAFIIELYGGK